MHGGEYQVHLSGMMGHATDRSQQQRPAGDGFQPRAGMRHATVPTPPVVDQRHSRSTQIATLDVLCAVSAQAPLVFEFIKAILVDAGLKMIILG